MAASQVELNEPFPTQILIYPRPHDTDRNGRLSLHCIATFATFYRRHTPINTPPFGPFLKAQHVTFRNNNYVPYGYGMRQDYMKIDNSSNILTPIPMATLNYMLEYGKSSIWTITHLCNMMTREIIADDLVLVINVNKITRKRNI